MDSLFEFVCKFTLEAINYAGVCHCQVVFTAKIIMHGEMPMKTETERRLHLTTNNNDYVHSTS